MALMIKKPGKNSKKINYCSISVGNQGIGKSKAELNVSKVTDKMLLLASTDQPLMKLKTRLLVDELRKVKVTENMKEEKLMFEVYSDTSMDEAQSFLATAAKEFVDTRKEYYTHASANLKIVEPPRAKRKSS